MTISDVLHDSRRALYTHPSRPLTLTEGRALLAAADALMAAHITGSDTGDVYEAMTEQENARMTLYMREHFSDDGPNTPEENAVNTPEEIAVSQAVSDVCEVFVATGQPLKPGKVTKTVNRLIANRVAHGDYVAELLKEPSRRHPVVTATRQQVVDELWERQRSIARATPTLRLSSEPPF